MLSCTGTGRFNDFILRSNLLTGMYLDPGFFLPMNSV